MGGTVAAVVIIAAIILGLLFWKRHHSDSQQHQSDLHKLVSTVEKNVASAALRPSPYTNRSRNSDNLVTNGKMYPTKDKESLTRTTERPISDELGVGLDLMSIVVQAGSALTSVSNYENYSSAHRRDDGDSHVPSVSHVAVASTSTISSDMISGVARGNDALARMAGKTAALREKILKKTLLNEELYSEVGNLRRELERLWQERERVDSGMAPPSY